MEHHQELTDLQFSQQFVECSLPSHLFNHEAHLRLAWIRLNEVGVKYTPALVCEQIINYVTHLGALDKFNKTLTVAATLTVNHFKQKSSADNFSAFLSENPRLAQNFKSLIASHYSFDIYHSADAKSTYLAPDLLPFS